MILILSEYRTNLPNISIFIDSFMPGSFCPRYWIKLSNCSTPRHCYFFFWRGYWTIIPKATVLKLPYAI